MESPTPGSTAKKVATKAQRSQFWFVRADGPEEFLRQKWVQLSQQLDVKAVLAVFHVGGKKENPHCHACIELTTSPQKQSVDDRLKRLFSIVKGHDYSSKIWDGERGLGAGSYMFHEGANVLVNKGWSDAEIEEAKKANEAVQKVIKVNNERASTKLVDKALLAFVGMTPSRREILRYMLKECRDGGSYYPGTFMLKKYVEEVQLKLTTNDDFEEFLYEVESQIWRQ